MENNSPNDPGGRPMIWDGRLDQFVGDGLNLRNALADAAHRSDWDTVLRLLDENPQSLSPNMWRPLGKSWFTPLHQAAWSNAPVTVVEELLSRGAWRLAITSAGATASDIALHRGYTELATVLAPKLPQEFNIEIYRKLDHQLAQLLESRIRPELDVRLRHPSCDVLTEHPEKALWYPIPGMYGGFRIELMRNYLVVDSSSRMSGGQAFVVTTEGFTLIDEYFE